MGSLVSGFGVLIGYEDVVVESLIVCAVSNISSPATEPYQEVSSEGTSSSKQQVVRPYLMTLFCSWETEKTR